MDYSDYTSEFFYERKQDYVVSPEDGIPCCGYDGFCDADCLRVYEETFAEFEGTSCKLADKPVRTVNADDPDDIDF